MNKRVLIIGGYGEFGGRLAELLLRDGHHVLVAGRDKEKAETFCQRIGGFPVQLDISEPIELINELIARLNVDIVVDAAGPYQQQAQHAEPYRVAKIALQNYAHYFDLSDDGNFSEGINVLDTEANNKQLCVLSGASSTPALSGAAVRELAKDFASINTIETSILPGSKAPMGQSVMLAILSQVGETIPVWQNGSWVDRVGWLSPKTICIDPSVNRTANLINAADAVLFPKYFKASTVYFRAGLAMPVMHRCLEILASLRRRKLLPKLPYFIKPLSFIARIIAPFGNDRGGMRVSVIGENESQIMQQGQWQTADWILTAELGQGPFIPTIAVRALIANLNEIKPGARVCVGDLSLAQINQAMQDIGASTTRSHGYLECLFKQVLCEKWDELPVQIKDSHSFVNEIVLRGEADIVRGPSLIARAVATVFRFPSAKEKCVVTVVKSRAGDVEHWQRSFAGQVFNSSLSPVTPRFKSAPGSINESLIHEQFGLLKFVLKLSLNEGSLRYEVQSGRVLGVPIPRRLLPISDTAEYVEQGRMHFSVKLIAPLGFGLIVHYSGWLEPDSV